MGNRSRKSMSGSPLVISGTFLLVYNAIKVWYIFSTFGDIQKDSLFAVIFTLMMIESMILLILGSSLILFAISYAKQNN
jgi:hypothetical protein